MDDLQNSEASKTVEEESKNTTSNKLLRNTLPNSSLPESLTTENAYEVFSNESILNQTDYVENDRGTHARSRSFSQLLVGAMTPSGLLNPLSPTLVASPRFQAQFGMSHQQALASVTAQAVQAQDKMQIQSGYPPSSSSVHPYSVLGDITPQLKNPLLGSGDMPITFVVDEQSNNDKDVQPNQLDLKSLQGDLKTPCDGYNWRKYGQKQVKGSERSRSYYRCSNTKCIVKKTIERCSDGFVHEIVYKGHHNHERPEKIRSSKENFHPAGSSGETDKVNVAGGKSCIADSSLSSQEYGCVSDSSCQQLQNSTNVRDTILTVSNEGNDNEPSPKRRNKDTISESQVFQFKIGREPKVVLQTESETGILGDGYRWRKYGQKLVKGNPNPRSYYKCTTMGCPVRKHVEKASDNTKAILVTYEGNHNHDLPSPKGGRDPSASALLYAAAAMTNGGELKSPSLFTYRLTSTRTKANRFDEKTLELGGQKALESAQTLLSIGLNPSISSSPDKNEEKRNIIERPLLSEAHAAVSV